MCNTPPVRNRLQIQGFSCWVATTWIMVGCATPTRHSQQPAVVILPLPMEQRPTALGSGQACPTPTALTEEQRQPLQLAQKGGMTLLRHAPLGFALLHPGNDFVSKAEDRPMMTAALSQSDDTVSYPYFDDFSRSFLVVRVTKVSDGSQATGEAVVREIERKLMEGARAELGPRIGLVRHAMEVTWTPEDRKVSLAMEVDDRLYARISTWPVGGAGGPCRYFVSLVSSSIDADEMSAVHRRLWLDSRPPP